MRAFIGFLMTPLHVGSLICIRFADTTGILPILSSDRFMRIRPNDAMLALIAYKIMIFGILAALLFLVATEGMFAALLFLVFVPTIIILFCSFLVRLILEVLLVINT